MIILNDNEVDVYITKRVQDLDLQLYDFIQGRVNIYQILTEGEYDQFRPLDKLAIPVKDLVRYWWNNFADQEGFLDDVLDHIYTEFKDRMLPAKEPVEEPEFSDAFDKVAESL